MRTLLVMFFAILSTGIVAQTRPSDDIALLKPDHRAYDDAVKFGKALNDSGVRVNKILRSKLDGFFRGVDRAAYYQTEKGPVEAIFFPDNGAEKIQVTESTVGARYIYSFTGQPRPNPPGDIFNSSKPMYFLAHDNTLVVIWGDEELFKTLKAGLAKTEALKK